MLTLSVSAIQSSFPGVLSRVWRSLHPARPSGRSIRITGAGLLVEGHDEAVPLSEDEARLLTFLLGNRGRVFTPETLLSRLWWPEHQHELDFVATRVAALNALLARAGLPDPMIEDLPNVGYRLKTEAEAG